MPKLPATPGIVALLVTYGVVGRGLPDSVSVRAFVRAAKRSHAPPGARTR